MSSLTFFDLSALFLILQWFLKRKIYNTAQNSKANIYIVLESN